MVASVGQLQAVERVDDPDPAFKILQVPLGYSYDAPPRVELEYAQVLGRSEEHTSELQSH